MPDQVRSVLYVTTCLPRFANDFAGSFVFRFARNLTRSGVRVTAITPGAPDISGHETMDGVDIVRFTYFRPRYRQCLCYDGGGIASNLRNSWLARIQVPFLFVAMTSAVRRHARDHDLIHCHWLPTVWAAWLAQLFSRNKRPIVFTNWGSDTRLLPGWLIRLSLRAVTACASTAEETDQHLIANGIEDFTRIRTPVDTDRFHASVPADRFFTAEGIPADRPMISFVGRMTHFKDPLTFIEACRFLSERNIAYTAVLAGDGELAPQCQTRVEELGLQDLILLLGTRNDVEYIFAASTITVHISPVENTWANTISEAMQTGCPVILTRVGYTERTFTHRENVYLVEPEDPSDLADALEKLLQDSVLRQRLSNGGWQLLVDADKDPSSVTRKLLAFYSRAIGERERMH